MLITRAYKVRLYPTKDQEVRLEAILRACRWVYNHYLEERKNHYLEHKKTLPYAAMSRDLTQLRKKEELLKDIQTVPIQQSLRRLDSAYNSFFRKQNKFPRFKSRFDNHQSFQKPKDWRVVGNRIQIQKDLNVKFRGNMNEKADLGTLFVSRDSTGKWFASVVAQIKVKTPKKYTAPIGIDVGLETLATLSTGKKFPNIRAQEKLQAKLTKAQRELARKQRGSNRRIKAKVRIARVYEKIRNIRTNHVHNITAEIVKKNPSVIAIEDLNVSNMMKDRRVSRSLGDASLKEVLRQIEYKQKWNGGKVVKIDRYFPSSKTCSKCGFIVDELPLSKRSWKCEKCATIHDRDINAAKVILAQSSAYGERGTK